MMLDAILVPLGLFLLIGVTVCVGLHLRYRTRRDLQTTIQAAIEHGQQLPAEFIEAISHPAAKTQQRTGPASRCRTDCSRPGAGRLWFRGR